MDSTAPMSEIMSRLDRIEAMVGNDDPPAPEWYTIKQTAIAWGISPRTIQRRVKKGKLVVNENREIHKDAVAAYLRG